MKPGWKTTEFWLSLLAMILGALLSSGMVGDATTWHTIVGGAIAALAALGYSGARMGTKKADSAAAALATRPLFAANDNENKGGTAADPIAESG